MTVQFAAPVRVDTPAGAFYFDGNSKITAGNGTFDEPVANAFSLVEVDDCPGSTPTCRAACYVQGLRVLAPEVHAKYEENSRTMRALMTDGDEYDRDRVADCFAEYIDQHCRGGFRWHVSGDIFSARYAEFIADVTVITPDVRHWIYTRSHDLIGPLLGRPNLALNLSADRDNLMNALQARQWAMKTNRPAPKIAYLADGDGRLPWLPADSIVFPDYALRGRDLEKPTDAPWWQSLTPAQRKMTCPVDFFGPSRSSRCGVCTKCM